MDSKKENPSGMRVALIVLLGFVIILIVCGHISDIEDGYEREIKRLEKVIEEDEEYIEELEYEIEELNDYNTRLRDQKSEDYEENRERYWALYQQYDQLRFEKSVPIYHCNHSESSIINLVISFIDEYGSLENHVEYSLEDGMVAIHYGLIDDYEEWILKLEEAVGYSDYLEYQWYLSSKEEYAD